MATKTFPIKLSELQALRTKCQRSFLVAYIASSVRLSGLISSSNKNDDDDGDNVDTATQLCDLASVYVCQYVTRRVSALRPSSGRAVPASLATSTRCVTRSKCHTSRRVWTRAQALATCSPSTFTRRLHSSAVSTSIYCITLAGPSSALSTANTAVSEVK